MKPIVVCAVLFLACGQVVAQHSVSPLDEDGRVVNFERDIAPIFVKHCLECHGPEDAKADFRVDEVDTVMQYVEPEDLESSYMFDLMVSEDKDELMPPPTHGGPLSASELTLVRVWIEEGANWPEGFSMVAEGATEKIEPPAKEDLSLFGKLYAFQGFFHPATVHFPVALFSIGALFVVLSWKWPKLGEQIPLACLLLGAPSAVVATIMGMAFAPQQGYGDWTVVDFDSEVFWHRWSGVIVAVVALVIAAIALIAVLKQRESLDKVWKIGLLVLAGMVGLVGHQGGELAYPRLYEKAFGILLGEAAEAEAPAEEKEGCSEASEAGRCPEA